MINERIQCVKKLGFYFRSLQRRYLALINTVSSHHSNEAQFLNDWLTGNNSDSPILRLTTSYNSWGKSSVLENEVDFNIINNNVGYFDFLDNQFSKQWNFINTHFKESIDLYVNEQELVTNLLDNLNSNNPQGLTKNSLIRSIQFQYIMLFELIEEQFFNYNNKHVCRFKPEIYVKTQKSNCDYITLDYGAKNDEAIGILYDRLFSSGLLISNFAEFSSHFSSISCPSTNKISWQGTLIQLLVLFMGKEMKANDGRGTFINRKLRLKQSVRV